MNNIQLLHQSNLVTSIKKIGIFDSGIGGISILQQLMNLSGLEFLYVADTAHVPYGKRSQKEIQNLTYSAIKFLVEQQVDLIIVACHTASTNALDFLQEKFPTVQFIDVVDLVIEQALSMTISGRIGILATQATVNSGIHKKRLLNRNAHLEVFTQACPRLASAIEKEYENHEKLTKLVDLYLKPLLNSEIDILILGCTHYDLIKNIIQQAVGNKIKIISAEQGIKNKLDPFITRTEQTFIPIQWFISGNRNSFRKTVTSLMHTELTKISKIK